MDNLKEIHACGFSGADMMLMLGDKQIAELQAISAKEVREPVPIYTMPDMPSCSPYSIAGSLIITYIYDEEAFNNDELKIIEIRYYNELYTDYLPCYITEVELLPDGDITTEKAIMFVGKEILKGEKPHGSKTE